MLSKTFLKKMKETLLIQKKEMVVKSTLDKDIDMVDTHGDETDKIQGNLLIELQNQLIIRNAEKLYKIDSALDKIDLKTYGLCEDCGESISEKRLLFNPHFLTCVSCAEERETEEKQRKRL